MSGAQDPKGIIAAKIAAGQIDGLQVARARSVWSERLQDGIRLPNDEWATISERSFYHIVEDARIRRKPERLVRLLNGIFEIRRANHGRRMALSRWEEDGAWLVRYAILTAQSAVWTMHVSREQEIRRLQRRGDVLWKR